MAARPKQGARAEPEEAKTARKTTQWWRIKKTYLSGNISYRELAEKYGLSERTVRNRAYKEGWGKEKDKVETEVSEKIRATAVRAREEQLKLMITANDRMAKALDLLTEEIEKNPMILLGAKGDGKAADSISKAILTTIQCQRDLHKLPTLDQDMRRKEEAQRKREIKARLEIEREKLQMQRDRNSDGDDTVVWTVEIPEGSGAIDE
jgi:hypothetical protein